MICVISGCELYVNGMPILFINSHSLVESSSRVTCRGRRSPTSCAGACRRSGHVFLEVLELSDERLSTRLPLDGTGLH
jgi:hypothetical protein